MSDDINRATEKLTEALETVFGARKASLDSFLNLQSLANVAIQGELLRLERLYGPDDPRTLSMKSRLGSNLTTLRTLEVQRGLASIRPVAKAEAEVLVEGWVGDANGRAAEGLNAQLVDLKGAPIAGVDAASVESGGYFAFKLAADAAARIAETNLKGVTIRVVDRQNTVVATSAETVVLADKSIPPQRIIIKPATESRSSTSPSGKPTGSGGMRSPGDKEGPSRTEAPRTEPPGASATPKRSRPKKTK